MSINPDILVDHNVQIESTVMSEDANLGHILVIHVKRISDSRLGAITLMRGYDPNGDWSERLKPGNMPKSIEDFFCDFHVKDETELVRTEKLRLNGVYFKDHLVGLSSFVCLNRFPEHSFDPWYWDKSIGQYKHSCSLLGCNFSESDSNVHPTGMSKVLDRHGKEMPRTEQCDHSWGHWQNNADQSGLYTPPFLYKIVCSLCGAQWLAQSLAKGQ